MTYKGYDIICFSHLRWDFVYQRPQHLLSRFARDRRAFYVEEPVFGAATPELQIHKQDNLIRIVPQMPREHSDIDGEISSLLDTFLKDAGAERYVAWYYTPLMLKWSKHIRPLAVVYDCMDELSMFKFAPPDLCAQEERLLSIADLVFTGGRSLYEAKRDQHSSVYCFPSSIDKKHFARARNSGQVPDDQKEIPLPRIGFFGVIDERTDLELLSKISELRPNYHFVMIGPVVKIDEADLPRAANIHYLGNKSYQQLPEYIAGWDVAMMPFAMNDSTKFISPTKTPEYLAAGRPVVSTPVRDVVRPYGEEGLVHVADSAEEFVEAIDKSINCDRTELIQKADEFLEDMSWDKTYSDMLSLIDDVVLDRPFVDTYAISRESSTGQNILGFNNKG